MRISNKLLCGFAIVIALTTILGAVGIAGMNRLRTAGLFMYENEVLGLEYIGKAEAAFKQMRIDCRQVIICGLYDDAKGAADAKQAYEQSAEEFTYWLGRCQDVSGNAELSEFYQRIEEILVNDYLPIGEVLIETSIGDMPDHVDKYYINALLASLMNAGGRIENLMIGSIDLNVALAERANNMNDSLTHLFMGLQISLFVIAVAAAVIIALYITRSISVPIHESSQILSKIAKGDFNARVNGNYKGEMALIKNSVNETAAQLLVYLNEKLQVEKIRNLAAIVANADAGIIVKDKNGVVTEWNIGAENLLGYKLEEMLGNTTHYYAPEESRADIDDIGRRLEQGEHIAHVEVVRKHKDGHLVDCSASYTPIFDDEGLFVGSVAIFHDISDIKIMQKDLHKALREAEEASQVKSTFLANMSHEIRTPMNAVISMSELLLEEKLSPRQHEYLMDIKTSGENLLGIINDILDFSKIESGKFEIAPVHFDLSAMMANLHSTFTFIAREKHLRFIAQTEADVPRYLYGDDIRIRQVLTNLLSNAVKFTAEGTITLKTRADADCVYFDISDTGIGIAQGDIDRLFDSFQQLDAAANRKKTGTGLGLSITKSLVEMMDGRITVQSEYGVGTTFHVKLPRADGDPDRLKRDERVDALAISAPDALVLVVDDYAANLRVAAGLLGLSAITCDTASSGEAALEMLRQKPYDLVFMDHMMPGMDGVETTQHIRKMGYGMEDLPIIALTANAVSGVKEMLLEQGMNDFLSKPIDRMLLSEMLVKWLPPHKVRMLGEAGAAPVDKGEALPSAFIQSLPAAVPEVNFQAALERMGGLEDLYESAFSITYNMLAQNIAKMDEYLQSGLGDFAIEVHGLKGALNNIGCDRLGRYAAQLEKAAKEDDEAYCRENYPEFKKRLLEFSEKAGRVLDAARPGEKEEGNSELLYERLEKARIACEEYDSITAYDLLAELGRYRFSAEVDALLAETVRFLDSYDYENSLSRISQMEAMKKQRIY